MNLSPLFYRAINHVTDLHNGQVRKGSDTPYVSHLFGVASIVLDFGGDEEQAIAALFHDAIEDQGNKITLDEIEETYGARVRKIVSECTEVEGQEGVAKPPWKDRKDAYIAAMTKKSEDTLLVACADKLHNLLSMAEDYKALGEELWSKFKGGKDGTFWFNEKLSDIFNDRLDNPIAAEYAKRLVKFKQHVMQ